MEVGQPEPEVVEHWACEVPAARTNHFDPLRYLFHSTIRCPSTSDSLDPSPSKVSAAHKIHNHALLLPMDGTFICRSFF